MHKIKTYWWALQSSLQDPNYYFSLPTASVWFSIQFFLFSLLLIAVYSIPNFAFRQIPRTLTFVRSELSHIVGQIPEDAVFTYENEKLVIQGASLPLTLESSSALQQVGVPKNILTLSAVDEATSTALTIGPKKIFVRDEAGKTSDVIVQEFFGEKTGSLSRDQLRTMATAILDTIEAAKFQIALLLSVGSLLASILYGLFPILFYSVILQVIGWTLGCRISYRAAARWGLHLFPIAFGIGELSSLIDSSGTFPIVAVAYIAIGTLILWVGRTSRPTIII